MFIVPLLKLVHGSFHGQRLRILDRLKPLVQSLEMIAASTVLVKIPVDVTDAQVRRA